MSAADISTTQSTKGPIRTAIEAKLTEAFQPESLTIRDDSSKHAHHAAMRGNTAAETHFAVNVVSNSFAGKTLIQRHQMIYKLLDVEMKEQGLHALQITAKTPEEVAKANLS